MWRVEIMDLINYNSTSSPITWSQKEQSQVGHIRDLSLKGIIGWDIATPISLVRGDWPNRPLRSNPKLG